MVAKILSLAFWYAGEWLAEGDSRRRQGDLLGALNAYSKALDLNSKDLKCLLKIGITYYLLGRTDDAITSYREALKINPAEPVLSNNLGIIYQGIRDFDNSIELFMSAIRLNKAYVDPYTHLAEVYEEIGRPELALSVLGECINHCAPNQIVHYKHG